MPKKATPRKAKQVVPASVRTLSLFTKRTDAEDPNARDGSEGVQRAGKKKPRTAVVRQVKWVPDGHHFAWVTYHTRGTKKGLVRDRIERTEDGEYKAVSQGTLLGIFPDLISATNAAERA